MPEWVPARCLMCSAGARPHLGTQGQMPPAFLVLHAPMSCTLIVQDNMFGATPAGLPAACWRIQSGLRAVPTRSVTHWPDCPGKVLDVMIVHYATIYSCTPSLAICATRIAKHELLHCFDFHLASRSHSRVANWHAVLHPSA